MLKLQVVFFSSSQISLYQDPQNSASVSQLQNQMGQMSLWPMRKLLHLTASTKTLLQVCEDVKQRYHKLYPEDEILDVDRVRDNDSCDLDPDYIVGDIFSSGDIIQFVVNNKFEDKPNIFGGYNSSILENSQEVSDSKNDFSIEGNSMMTPSSAKVIVGAASTPLVSPAPSLSKKRSSNFFETVDPNIPRKLRKSIWHDNSTVFGSQPKSDNTHNTSLPMAKTRGRKRKNVVETKNNQSSPTHENNISLPPPENSPSQEEISHIIPHKKGNQVLVPKDQPAQRVTSGMLSVPVQVQIENEKKMHELDLQSSNSKASTPFKSNFYGSSEEEEEDSTMLSVTEASVSRRGKKVSSLETTFEQEGDVDTLTKDEIMRLFKNGMKIPARIRNKLNPKHKTLKGLEITMNDEGTISTTGRTMGEIEMERRTRHAAQEASKKFKEEAQRKSRKKSDQANGSQVENTQNEISLMENNTSLPQTEDDKKGDHKSSKISQKQDEAQTSVSEISKPEKRSRGRPKRSNSPSEASKDAAKSNDSLVIEQEQEDVEMDVSTDSVKTNGKSKEAKTKKSNTRNKSANNNSVSNVSKDDMEIDIESPSQTSDYPKTNKESEKLKNTNNALNNEKKQLPKSSKSPPISKNSEPASLSVLERARVGLKNKQSMNSMNSTLTELSLEDKQKAEKERIQKRAEQLRLAKQNLEKARLNSATQKENGSSATSEPTKIANKQDEIMKTAANTSSQASGKKENIQFSDSSSEDSDSSGSEDDSDVEGPKKAPRVVDVPTSSGINRKISSSSINKVKPTVVKSKSIPNINKRSANEKNTNMESDTITSINRKLSSRAEDSRGNRTSLPKKIPTLTSLSDLALRGLPDVREPSNTANAPVESGKPQSSIVNNNSSSDDSSSSSSDSDSDSDNDNERFINAKKIKGKTKKKGGFFDLMKDANKT